MSILLGMTPNKQCSRCCFINLYFVPIMTNTATFLCIITRTHHIASLENKDPKHPMDYTVVFRNLQFIDCQAQESKFQIPPCKPFDHRDLHWEVNMRHYNQHRKDRFVKTCFKLTRTLERGFCGGQGELQGNQVTLRAHKNFRQHQTIIGASSH